MMKCKQVSLKLSEYLNEELSPTATAQIKSHIKECVHCQNELAVTKKALIALQTPIHPFDAPDIQSVLEMIPTSSKPKISTTTRWSFATAGALILISILGQGSISSRTNHSTHIYTKVSKSIKTDQAKPKSKTLVPAEHRLSNKLNLAETSKQQKHLQPKLRLIASIPAERPEKAISAKKLDQQPVRITIVDIDTFESDSGGTITRQPVIQPRTTVQMPVIHIEEFNNDSSLNTHTQPQHLLPSGMNPNSYPEQNLQIP
jgi:hypothetical protein